MVKSSFDQYKERAMASLRQAIENKEVDEPILPYLNIINSYDSFYTTSSCYGRITLDLTPVNENKKDHSWLGKWHRVVSYEDINKKLEEASRLSGWEIVWLKQDPFILHIGAKTINDAEKLLHAARELSGLKRVGIMHTTPRIMIEVMGLDFMSCPLLIKDKKIIEKQELKNIIDIANLKFGRNEERLKVFISNLQKIMEA